LPLALSDVHDVFHISQLRKCIAPPAKQVDMSDLELAKDLTYEENLSGSWMRWKEPRGVR
jgi:hypothetical protein